MSPESSDFAERLKAMREGKKAAPLSPSMPSLKDRLQKHSPAGPTSQQDDIRSRIQSKFKQQAEAQKQKISQMSSQEASADTSMAPSHEPTSAPPELEQSSLPEVKQQKEDKTQQWTPENGGVCPACSTYNMAHVVFCGNCSYMLLRTEEEVEIITSYPLTEIRGLVHTFTDKLAKLNVRTTEDLLRTGIAYRNRQTLIKHSGMSERSLLRLLHQANFCRIPSMGPENAAMLELIGITTMDELLKQKPLELYKKIQQAKIKLNQSGIMFLPTKSQVQTWLEEAQSLPAIKIQ